jgi:hypothetical protein
MEIPLKPEGLGMFVAGDASHRKEGNNNIFSSSKEPRRGGIMQEYVAPSGAYNNLVISVPVVGTTGYEDNGPIGPNNEFALKKEWMNTAI